MYDNYGDESYYEPENFLEQYELGIREILTKAVNDKIGDTVEELKVLKSINEELEKQIKELRSNLYNTDKIHKEQLDKALKENTKEVERKLSCGFTPHDVVWYIKSESSHTKCEKCNGKGKVEIEVLGKMTNVNCPYCSSGNVYKHTYFPEKDIISAIYFDFHRADRSNKNSGANLTVRDIYFDRCDYTKKPEDLYKTLEECQKHCDELNAKSE